MAVVAVADVWGRDRDPWHGLELGTAAVVVLEVRSESYGRVLSSSLKGHVSCSLNRLPLPPLALPRREVLFHKKK